MLLFKLKKMAQKYIGTNIDSAIFSIPPYSNDSQIESIKKKGKMTPFKYSRVNSNSYMALLGYIEIKI